MIGRGWFEPWRSLSNPPIDAERILNADYRTIWVKLKNEKIVTMSFDCYGSGPAELSCSEWVETEIVPEHPFFQMLPLQRSAECKFESLSYSKAPPGKVTECVMAEFIGPEYMHTTIFAVLDDGSVWYWRLYGDSLGPFPSLLLCASLIAPLIGLVISAIIYLARTRRHALDL